MRDDDLTRTVASIGAMPNLAKALKSISAASDLTQVSASVGAMPDLAKALKSISVESRTNIDSILNRPDIASLFDSADLNAAFGASVWASRPDAPRELWNAAMASIGAAVPGDALDLAAEEFDRASEGALNALQRTWLAAFRFIFRLDFSLRS